MIAMRFSVTLLCLFLGVSLAYDITFDTLLDGDNQSTPVVTLGRGSGTFKYDTDSQKLSWDLSYEFLDSGVTMAHIHGPAEIGEDSGVFITLNIKEGNTDDKFSGSEYLTRDQADFLMDGLTYVNIHTTNHPNGEIRGQILSTSKFYKANLSGSQEAPTPVIDTLAEGSAEFSFDYTTKTLKYQINHSVEDITGIHLHGPARMGETAEPIFVFSDDSDSLSGSTVLSDLHTTCLRSGLLYLNLHSEVHPDGEIRGQVIIDEDGTSIGDDDWWQVGLILVAVLSFVVVLSAVAIVVYQKKGDAIRNAMATGKSQEVRMSLSEMNGISNEPLLGDVNELN